MRVFLLLVVVVMIACTPVEPTLPLASDDDLSVALSVLPVLNATFPYRVEANHDPKDPLGVRRVPTDRVVLKPATAPPDLVGAVPYLNASVPGNDALVDSWQKANGEVVLWPRALAEGPAVVPFDRVATPFERDGWKGLTHAAPLASSLVTLSRPGYTADGKRALLAASVERSRPPRLEVYYLLERDGSNWVVTNSVSRQR